jgi:hypothetical protein
MNGLGIVCLCASKETVIIGRGDSDELHKYPGTGGIQGEHGNMRSLESQHLTIVPLDWLVVRYSGIYSEAIVITVCPYLKLSGCKVERRSHNHFRLHVWL